MVDWIGLMYCVGLEHCDYGFHDCERGLSTSCYCCGENLWSEENVHACYRSLWDCYCGSLNPLFYLGERL